MKRVIQLAEIQPLIAAMNMRQLVFQYGEKRGKCGQHVLIIKGWQQGQRFILSQYCRLSDKETQRAVRSCGCGRPLLSKLSTSGNAPGYYAVTA